MKIRGLFLGVALLATASFAVNGCALAKAFESGPSVGETATKAATAGVELLLNQYKAEATQVNVKVGANDPRYTATVLAGPVFLTQIKLQADGVDANLGLQSYGQGVESINPDQADRMHEILTTPDRTDKWREQQLFRLLGVEPEADPGVQAVPPMPGGPSEGWPAEGTPPGETAPSEGSGSR